MASDLLQAQRSLRRRRRPVRPVREASTAHSADLERTGYNQTAAARLLNIPRKQLGRKIKAYRIERLAFPSGASPPSDGVVPRGWLSQLAVETGPFQPRISGQMWARAARILVGIVPHVYAPCGPRSERDPGKGEPLAGQGVANRPKGRQRSLANYLL